jgi:hypothetical protein
LPNEAFAYNISSTGKILQNGFVGITAIEAAVAGWIDVLSTARGPQATLHYVFGFI